MTTMTTILAVGRAMVGFSLAALAAGCDDGRGGPAAETAGETGVPAAIEAAETTPAVSPALVELERVLRRVDRAEATEADAEALAAWVREGKLPVDAIDRASLGLSAALEADGDEEGAIRAVEELLKRHSGDRHFDAREAAVSRLRRLLTGSEEAPPSMTRNLDPVAPIARALAAYFPEDDGGATLVDVLSVGKGPTEDDPHGILNIGDAKRRLAEEECAVCDVEVHAQGSHTRIGSWVDLPLQMGERRSDMPNPDRSMVVVWFDLVENRVPSRYDAYLAVPSAETVARLERGEAFVAVRERPGKKPLVLLAAPRVGQLDQVQSAFAQMTSLPTTPRPIEVSAQLWPHEIQGVVRGGFRGFRTCYEALLAREPGAGGNVTVKLRIDEGGTPRDVTATSTFGDDALRGCMVGLVKTLRFPAAGQETSVTYPIAFSP